MDRLIDAPGAARMQLDLGFLSASRQRELAALRPGDRLTRLRRERLLPLAQGRDDSPAMAADSRLAELLQAFHAAAIDVLVLKGAALAYSVYAHPAHRPRTDTDLLVRAEQRAAAVGLLNAHGYRSASTSAHDPLARQMSFSVDGPTGLTIDLHFALANQPEFAELFSFDELAAHAIELPRLSPIARGLHPEHALLHAVIHYYAHLPAATRPAIWLLDIALLARGLDAAGWLSLDERVHEAGCSALVATAIETTRSWFVCPCPPELLATWTGRAGAEWRSVRAQPDEPALRELGLALRAMPSTPERLRYLWRRLFPTAAWMRALHGPLGPAGLVLAYLRRLLAGVGRRIR